MRTCLSPFFIGVPEPGLAVASSTWDTIVTTTATGSRPMETVVDVNRRVSDHVCDTLRTGDQALVVAGDCLSALGCVAGVQRAGYSFFLLWFDAHGDFHTPSTTVSGHLGGMPLAMITGRGDLTLARQ